MWEQILAGVVTGIGYSLVGWKRPNNNKVFGEKFNWASLAKSVLVCVAVGAIAGYSGQDFNVLLTGSLGIGATKGIGVIWDYLKYWFFRKKE